MLDVPDAKEGEDWMIKINVEKCNGCGACVNICPVGAITLISKARLDSSRCVNCRICLTVCPEKAVANR